MTCFMAPIPKHTRDSEILEFFRNYNPIDCKKIIKSETNIFTFIRFSSYNDCERAYNELNGKVFKGNTVVVNCSYNDFETGVRMGDSFQRRQWDNYDDNPWFY